MLLTHRSAVTKVQSVIIIVIIIAAAGVGAAFYYTSTPAAKTTTTTTTSTKPITFGILAPLTDVTGIDTKEGAQLAVSEINAAGGVLGRPIQLVYEDTHEADPTIPVDTALAAMNRIVTVDGAQVIIGGERSDVVLAEEAQLPTYKVPFLDVGAADTTLGQNVLNNYTLYKYFFMASPVNSTALATALITYYATLRYTNSSLTKVYIMAEDIAVWHALVPVLQAELPTFGYSIVGTDYFPYGASDFSSDLSAVRSSGAQIICLLAAGQDSVQLIQQWATLQIPAVPIGIDVAAESPSFWGQTSGAAKYETIEVGIGDSGTPINTVGANFYKNFSDAYGTLPIYTADGAYDAVYIAAKAIEEAGTTNGTALIPYLEQANFTGPDGLVRFDASHNVIWNQDYTKGAALAFVQWSGYNQYTCVWPAPPATKPLEAPPWM